MTKGLIQQKDITHENIYTPNREENKHIKQKQREGGQRLLGEGWLHFLKGGQGRLL